MTENSIARTILEMLAAQLCSKAVPSNGYSHVIVPFVVQESKTIDRNDWKHRIWDNGERMGWNNWERASSLYFQAGHIDITCITPH